MRKSTVRRLVLGAACAASVMTLPLNQRAFAQAGRQPATKAELLRWRTELSNWGRWGKDDELGALNLITPEKRRAAAALVKEGFSVSLARDGATEKAVDTPNAYEHVMLRTGVDAQGRIAGTGAGDRIAIDIHGYGNTHLDSLAHVFQDGKMYNGYSQAEVTQRGAGRNAILTVKGGIFTRGVLIDLPRLKGVPYLEPGTAIFPEDLEEWERRAGVRVSSGDAVFIRTGRWARRAAVGPWPINEQAAGLDASAARWFKQRDVAIIGSEAALSVSPSGVDGEPLALHTFVLVHLGVPLLDICDLDALAAAAAARNRWEFLLTAAPLPVPAGTGSPINPIATF